MNAKSIVLISGVFSLAAASLHASPRVSADYTVATDSADAGGGRAASANYSNSGSIGGVTGISTVAVPVEIAKHGYIGQLYDLASGISLAASPATVNEGGTRQLFAVRNLDDGTGLALDPATVAWSVLGGPILGISTGGLVTAGTVYQDTAASVQGIANGFTASFSLTVLDTIPDNFGLYAGDGIDDAWQMQYFGPNNANAGPNVDADGSGQTNLFKYLAGLNPLDPASRFVLNLAPAAGQPTGHNIVFSPIVAGRSYTVQYKNSLADLAWQTLTGATQSDNGATRTVNDPTAGPARFYRVQVSKP